MQRNTCAVLSPQAPAAVAVQPPVYRRQPSGEFYISILHPVVIFPWRLPQVSAHIGPNNSQVRRLLYVACGTVHRYGTSSGALFLDWRRFLSSLHRAAPMAPSGPPGPGRWLRPARVRVQTGTLVPNSFRLGENASTCRTMPKQSSGSI